MPPNRRTLILLLLLAAVSGCTGESVRVILPDRHPANHSAAEAPFVLPPDPFAGLPLPAVPSRPAEPHEHKHEHQQMDDMQMDDEKSGEMMHGGHGGSGAGERKEQQ